MITLYLEHTLIPGSLLPRFLSDDLDALWTCGGLRRLKAMLRPRNRSSLVPKQGVAAVL